MAGRFFSVLEGVFQFETTWAGLRLNPFIHPGEVFYFWGFAVHGTAPTENSTNDSADARLNGALPWHAS